MQDIFPKQLLSKEKVQVFFFLVATKWMHLIGLNFEVFTTKSNYKQSLILYSFDSARALIIYDRRSTSE